LALGEPHALEAGSGFPATRRGGRRGVSSTGGFNSFCHVRSFPHGSSMSDTAHRPISFHPRPHNGHVVFKSLSLDLSSPDISDAGGARSHPQGGRHTTQGAGSTARIVTRAHRSPGGDRVSRD